MSVERTGCVSVERTLVCVSRGPGCVSVERTGVCVSRED